MKVLLIGASGLLGHNVMARLSAEGHSIKALVRRSGAICIESGGWAEVVGSPLDYGVLLAASQECEGVVNCAGITDMSLLRIDDYRLVNCDLCGLLVRLMKENTAIKSLVHVSTTNTIGNGTAEHPSDESAPMTPPFTQSLYAQSKSEGESLILDYARHAEGRHVVVINPGYMLGGFDAKPSSGKMLLAAYRRRVMLAPCGGKAFVHVGDVAHAVVAALKVGESGSRYLVAGPSCGMTIADLYRMQARVMGYQQRVLPLPRWGAKVAGRIGDGLRKMGIRTQLSSNNVAQLLVHESYDSSRAVAELGIRFQPIEQAVADFYEWRKQIKK